MRREDAIKKTDEYLASKRAYASAELTRREKNIYANYPAITALLMQRAQLPLKALRSALSRKSSAADAGEALKTEGLRLNQAIRDELKKAGYPEDYLSMHYECSVCKDTGYVPGDEPGHAAEMCTCYKRKLSEFMRIDDGVSDFSRMSFETFDENRIPEDLIRDGLTQRAFTKRIRDICEDYADSFPNTMKHNIVLSGPAGVGKTFLLNCIAGRVESRGYNATIITAYRLLEAMRNKHLHPEEGSQEFDRLLSCPLLLIDDIGSEPILRNISREYLDLLINERMLKKLHTVITCNLTRKQICDIYDERIMSRLCDKENWDFFDMKGSDIRTYDAGRNRSL